jgi:hypothetical protein
MLLKIIKIANCISILANNIQRYCSAKIDRG